MRLFLLVLLTPCVHLFAHVIQTDSFEYLEKSIPELSCHDIVLFDYDKTLIMAQDALLQSCGKKCLTARLRAHSPSLSPKKIDELISIILLQRQTCSVEAHALALTQLLHDRGIKAFVLTALRTGSFGYIAKTEEWRLKELTAHGYDFRNAFPEITRIDFKEYRTRPYPPVFVEGILCSGSISKGEALFAFFKKMGFHPRRIIFVDNAADHHHSVEKWARRAKIPYLGYRYTGAIAKRKTVNEEIAHFQIQYLIENESWISDEEAERRIQWKNIPT